MFVANSHDTILCFSDGGKVYWLRTFQLPQAGRQARGRPLVNLLPLDNGEQVTAILPIKGYEDGKHVIMATSKGIIKKCRLTDFSRPRSNGIIAVNLQEDDHLVGVELTDGDEDILLVSDAGKASRFSERDVRVVGRTARGVRGIRLDEDHNVIALMVLPASDSITAADTDGLMGLAILTSTINGYGKRTLVSDFPRKNRGGKGVIAIKTSDRNGIVVSAHIVNDSDEVMLITDGGILIRTRVSEISTQGRNTQGVRLISLKDGEALVSVSKVADTEDEEEQNSSLH
jgi:DNA gyrase subunit A